MDTKKIPTFKEVFKKEWQQQTAKDKTRIIKFIAICIVPFLYGFFCVGAFGNPFLKTDQIPMAIITLKLNYLKNEATNFNPTDKYGVQLRIPEHYSSHLISILRNIGNNILDADQFLTDITGIINNPINLWATYKKNFLIGYFAEL